MLNQASFCFERAAEAGITNGEGVKMSGLRLGSNFAVFALFFGLSLLEAFQAGNWLRAAFWLAIATVFLYGDWTRRQEQK